MKTLNISTGSFDKVNTFTIAPLKWSTCKLYKGYQTEDDGIYWVMQCSAMLKAHYSDEDRAESKRLTEMEPIQNGEIVLIEGKEFKFNYKGNYSDCGIFEPVSE
jgi:hypothetical protein